MEDFKEPSKTMRNRGREFSCNICHKSLCNRAALKNHQEIHSSQRKKYKCDICNADFTLEGNLKRHLKKTNCKPKYFKCICSVCKSSFIKREDFREHLKTVGCGGKERYPCNICDKSFSSSHTVTLHLQIHDSLRRKYFCVTCYADFTFQTSLNKHIRNKCCSSSHAKEIRFCSICKSPFTKKEGFREHLKTVGCGGKENFPCRICKNTFTSLRGRRMHEETHKSVRQKYTCDTCKAEFFIKKSLTHHLRKSDCNKKSSKTICNVCNSSFANYKDWRQHYKTMGCGGRINVSCDICKKSFFHQNGHKRFQEIYCGRLAYICDTCKVGLTQKSVPKNHHKVKPSCEPNPKSSVIKYTCNVCNCSFEEWSSFQEHIKTVGCGKVQSQSKTPLKDTLATPPSSSLIQSRDNDSTISSHDDTFRVYVFKNTHSIDFLTFVSSKIGDIKKTISSEMQCLFNEDLLAASEAGEVECIEIKGKNEREVLEAFGTFGSQFIPISNTQEIDSNVTHMFEQAICSYQK